MRIVYFSQRACGFPDSISYLKLANEGRGERLDVNFTQQDIRKHLKEPFRVHNDRKVSLLGLCAFECVDHKYQNIAWVNVGQRNAVCEYVPPEENRFAAPLLGPKWL